MTKKLDEQAYIAASGPISSQRARALADRMNRELTKSPRAWWSENTGREPSRSHLELGTALHRALLEN